MMMKSQKSTFTALTMRRHQLLGASAMAFCLLDHDNSPEFRRDIDGRLFQSRCAKSTSEIEQQNELSRDGDSKKKKAGSLARLINKRTIEAPSSILSRREES